MTSTPQPAQSGPKINIATPAYQGQFSAPYVRSFYLLLSEGQRWGARFAFSEINYSDIVVGSAPPSGVTQEVLRPSPEGVKEQSGDDYLEADCSAPFIHYES